MIQEIGIYRIVSPSSKCYVGMTMTGFQKRWSGHTFESKRNISKAMKKANPPRLHEIKCEFCGKTNFVTRKKITKFCSRQCLTLHQNSQNLFNKVSKAELEKMFFVEKKTRAEVAEFLDCSRQSVSELIANFAIKPPIDRGNYKLAERLTKTCLRCSKKFTVTLASKQTFCSNKCYRSRGRNLGGIIKL